MAEGTVTVPGNLEGEFPIRFDMQRLVLRPVPGPDTAAGGEPDPRRVPALEFKVGDFAWQERRFGRFEAKIARDPAGLRLAELTASSPDFTIAAHGDWLVEGPGSRTRLAIELTSSDLGATSRWLGIPGEIEAKHAHATANLAWPGAPTGDIVARMNGTLELALEHMLSLTKDAGLQRGFSFWIGLAFIVLGALTSAAAILQFRKVLRSLKPVEIPPGYRVDPGILANAAVAVLVIALTVYLFVHGASL